MTAAEVKDALRGRHYASAAQMPGPWTCVEEWRGIDLVAFSAWSSAGRFARVGYEVKVSRSDLRRELLRPGKRASNVAWCNEFSFAVPKGLLTDEEIDYREPDWPDGAFTRERCPNPDRRSRGRCTELVPVPVTLSYISKYGDGWTRILCRTCGGSRSLGRSLVEETAPTLWIPRDVGLVVVDGRGTMTVRPSPRRKDVPALSPRDLGQLVRFVSMRPDPRHVRVVDLREAFA